MSNMTDRLAHLRPPDHGTDGPAQQSRPSRLIETIQAGVKCREMAGTHPIDIWTRTTQLTERQINAAWHLTKEFQRGFPARPVTSSIGTARGIDHSPEAAVAMTQARRNYDGLMSKIPHECRHALARMVRGEYPGISGGLQLIRVGTERLADVLQLPRETFTNDRGWE